MKKCSFIICSDCWVNWNIGKYPKELFAKTENGEIKLKFKKYKGYGVNAHTIFVY